MTHIMTCEGNVTPLAFPAWQLGIELRARSQETGFQTKRAWILLLRWLVKIWCILTITWKSHESASPSFCPGQGTKSVLHPAQLYHPQLYILQLGFELLEGAPPGDQPNLTIVHFSLAMYSSPKLDGCIRWWIKIFYVHIYTYIYISYIIYLYQ
jgi:hypothetical protein